MGAESRPAPIEFRRCVQADIPWLIVLGSRAYGPGRFDTKEAMIWIGQHIKNSPDTLIIRTQNAALIGIAAHDFLCPKRRYAYVPVIVGEGYIWEAVKLARVAKAWAKTRGATKFMMASDDDVPDVGPIARRIGLVPSSGMYEGDM